MPISGNTGAKMSRDWRQWEGQVVNGSFPLRQYLGGSDHSAVFLTERRGRDPQKAAIKLITVDPANTAAQLARWELAAKVSHPHLLRLFETGSCQLGSLVLLYVVMEFAEDNLGQILPHRPLTAEEARDLLEPALDALAYIHGKGLAHSRLRPSNVLAAQDQLKLSSDSLVRVDGGRDQVAGTRLVYPSLYDAPEVASGRISPASDSWSLGMTLMEALTQRLPAREGMAEPVLETVPAPFMGIAHCCLRRDPLRRCSAADIAGRLHSNSSPISKVMSRAQGPSTVRIPAGSAKWRYILPVAALILLGVAVLLGPRLLNQGPEGQPVSAVSAGHSPESPSVQRSPKASLEKSSDPQNGGVKSAGAPVAGLKPSARRPGATQSPSSVARPSEPIPVEPAARPTANKSADLPVSATGQGDVRQQVEPSVSRSARGTIHGTIRVRVRVEVDPSGNVQNASFVSEGPSKYFARQAMLAAQQWKFVPAQGQDPRSWIVRFGFTRSGTDATLEPSKP